MPHLTAAEGDDETLSKRRGRHCASLPPMPKPVDVLLLEEADPRSASGESRPLPLDRPGAGHVRPLERDVPVLALRLGLALGERGLERRDQTGRVRLGWMTSST